MPDRLDVPSPLAGSDTAAPALVGQPVAVARAQTLRLYAADWLHFVGWCRMNGFLSLPASVETLSAYLLTVAPDLSRGALGRRRATIERMHRLHELVVPRLDAPVRAELRRFVPECFPCRRSSSLAPRSNQTRI